ncbi:radical SAM protein [Mesorhizobium sp. M0244]|uniref:B12-binding domain-containing radical SAM protein n=1 Tax=Mesorhizobium sp. M0244 TaxID=2956926 RepID=UPI003334DEDA
MRAYVSAARDSFTSNSMSLSRFTQGRLATVKSMKTMFNLSETAPVFLIYPRLQNYSYKIQAQDRESLALGYLIGALESSAVEVNAINAELGDLSNDEVVDLIASFPNTRLIGISAGSEKVFPHVERMCKRLKGNGAEIHITTGGIFATTAYADILEQSTYIDSVCLGEGEHVIVELYQAIANGNRLDGIPGLKFRGQEDSLATTRSRISNLDSLSFPSRRDLTFMVSPEGPGVRKVKIATSRGCYARCSFCSIHEIFGNRLVQRRSVENIIQEIRYIIDRFAINRFSFMDDLFITPSTSGRAWVMSFCQEIVRQKLEIRFWIETRADTLDREIVDALLSAGMDSIFIGIEAGSTGVLKKMQKDVTAAQNLEALHLLRSTPLDPEDIRFGYIMFVPNMSIGELREQYEWIRRSGHCRVQTLQNRMNIYRGTPEYKRLKAAGKLREGPLGVLPSYDFDDPEVGVFERLFRAFHNRCVESVFSAVHDVQIRYISRRHKFSKPPRQFNLMSELLKRIEWIERDHYYRFFDAHFSGAKSEIARIEDATRDDIDELTPMISLLNNLIDQNDGGLPFDIRDEGSGKSSLRTGGLLIEWEDKFRGDDILHSSLQISPVSIR